MKHYNLVIDGKEVQSDKKGYVFKIEYIVENTPEALYLRIQGLPKDIVTQLKTNPSAIETEDLNLQYIVNSVKEKGFPSCGEEAFEKAIYATYTLGSKEDNLAAINSAKKAFRFFKSVPVDTRIRIVDEFIDKLSNSLGKFRQIAKGLGLFTYLDTNYNYNIAGMLNHNTLMYYKERMMPYQISKYNYLKKEPYGVFGIMLPYNDFLFESIISLAASIISGNACVVKIPKYPVVFCELITMLHAVLAEHDIPKGVVNTISGDSRGIISEWVNHPDVNGLVFYGESQIGLDIGSEATKKAKKMVYHLAGSSPVLVWKDLHDIDNAAEKVVIGRVLGSGQMCNAVKRTYVHEEIFDIFLQKMIKMMAKVKLSYPLSVDYAYHDQIIIGSLKSMQQVMELLDDAVSKGAKIEIGGKRINHLKEPDENGLFFEPTILSNVDHSMRIMNEECFGPILPVMKIRSVEEAIEAINSSCYGLKASVWSKDRAVIDQFVNNVQTGSIIVNEINNFVSYGIPNQGGVKLSGITGTSYLHEEMCYHKYVYESPIFDE